jgi:hypothetical protein
VQEGERSTFLTVWSSTVCDLYERILNGLFTESNTDALRLLGFHLHQFKRAIDITYVISSPTLFHQFSEVLEQLYEISQRCADRSSSLYRPLFPGSVFFDLFGEWLFRPFENSLGPAHVELGKLLIRMGATFAIPAPWRPVLLSAVVKTITVDSRPATIAALTHGAALIHAFPSAAVAATLLSAVPRMEVDRPVPPDFWLSFGLLLVNLCELSAVDIQFLDLFLIRTPDFRSQLAIFDVLLRRDLNAFFAELPVAAFGPQFTSLTLMVSLCHQIASVPAFLEFPSDGKIQGILDHFLRVVEGHSDNDALVYAVALMFASLAKWSDTAYAGNTAFRFLDFFAMLPDGRRNSVRGLARLTQGRPVNPRDKIAESRPSLVSFMSGFSLVTVCGGEARESSFVVQVREPRGLFVWELEDDQRTDTPQIVKAPIELPPIRRIVSSIAGLTGSEFDGLFDSTRCEDSLFTKASSHEQESRLLVHKLQKIDHLTDEQVLQHPVLHYRLRHKAIDFLIQTGFSGIVKKIVGDPKPVIAAFDAIHDCSIVRIPLFHFGEDGAIVEPTPLFNRFENLLGKRLFNSEVVTIELGLLTLHLSRVFPSDGFVCVLFSECSLKLNLQHAQIPKCELLFIVTPISDALYTISARCIDPTFWCSVLEERLVTRENIQAAICRSAFQFVAVRRRELFVAKDEERSSFLKSIETAPISVISLVNGHAFEQFGKS